MPDYPADLRTRLELLERQLAAVQRRPIDLADRPAMLGAKRQPRLAKTVAGGVAYPTRQQNPTVYWIVFLDATYADAVGEQAISAVARQANPIAKCYSLATTYIPENTEIEVFWDHGKWWTTGGPLRVEDDATSPQVVCCPTDRLIFDHSVFQLTTPYPGAAPQDERAVYITGQTAGPAWELRVKEDDDTPNVKPTETIIFDHYQFALTNPVAGDAKAVLVQLIGGGTAMLRWGKIQTTPPTGLGDTNKTVNVKSCAYDGTGVTGDAFDIYTPLRPRSTLDMAHGEVVGYLLDNGGKNVIVSDIWFDCGIVAEPCQPSVKLSGAGDSGTFSGVSPAGIEWASANGDLTSLGLHLLTLTNFDDPALTLDNSGTYRVRVQWTIHRHSTWSPGPNYNETFTTGGPDHEHYYDKYLGANEAFTALLETARRPATGGAWTWLGQLAVSTTCSRLDGSNHNHIGCAETILTITEPTQLRHLLHGSSGSDPYLFYLQDATVLIERIR